MPEPSENNEIKAEEIKAEEKEAEETEAEESESEIEEPEKAEEKEAEKSESEIDEPEKTEVKEAVETESELAEAEKEEPKVDPVAPNWEPGKTPDAKEVEMEARMRAMEAEMERLKKERIAFEEERKRFEAEKKAFEAGRQQALGQDSKTSDSPVREAPESANRAANNPAMNGAAAGRTEPSRNAVVNKKGNYTEMNLDDSSLTDKQADQTAKLNITADMTVLAKKSSKEFKMMQKAVERFDKFMKGMKGRTAFTPEELEKYDKLSHDVYKASDEYLKKKENDMEKRAPGKDGRKKQSDYEYSRVKAAEEIRETVEQMRQEMLDKALKAKIEEMNKRCADQLENLENSRNKLASDKDMEPDRMKSRLSDNAAHTIYYANRMMQLSANNELCMKPGESLNAAVNRLNTAIIPTKKEIDGIKEHPLTEKIVENGVKSLSDGKSFTYDDMRKTIKTEAAKKVPEVKKAKELEKEQAKQKEARQAAKKAEAKKQLKQSKKTAQAPARA